MDGSTTSNHTGTALGHNAKLGQTSLQRQQIRTFTNNLTLFLHFLQFDLHVFSLQVLLTAVVTMGVTAPPRPLTPVSAGQSDDNDNSADTILT